MAFNFNSICTIRQSFSGIEFRESVESADFDYATDTQMITRVYFVDWNLAHSLATALIGRFRRTGSNTMVWEIPHQDPQRPFLFAQRVRGEGLGIPSQGGPLGSIAFDLARIEVDYMPIQNDGEDPSENARNVTFITERRDTAAQAITLPKKKLFWTEGSRKGEPTADDAVAVFRIPTVSLIVTIHWWFDAPLNLDLENKLGDINKNSFRILQTVYPPKTLRFDHTSRSRNWTSEGLEAWQVTQKFMWREEEWNKYFDPVDGKFNAVETEAGTKLHKESDFRSLFPR